MSTFIPRTTDPSADNKYYIQSGSGGYNNCIYVTGNSVLPNCTGYAYGRFMECTKSKSCTLPTCDAQHWFQRNIDSKSYKYGKTPQLGAVICWGVASSGNYGHVAVVEKIYDNGDIDISESSWNGFRFNYQKILRDKLGNYKYGSKPFQGFIYNPGVDGYTTFVDGEVAPLYEGGTTSKDAIMREVGYLDGATGQPSITSTDIKLSVINYTPYLGALSAVLGYMGGSQDDNTILDKVEEVPRKIIEFFKDKGLPTSAGVGICANVKAECGFDISLEVLDSDGYYAGGMCMWNDHYKNLSNMKKYIKENFPGQLWSSSLTAQCSYLYYDMTEQQSGYFKKRMDDVFDQNIEFIAYLQSLPNTEAGAQDAAEAFMKVYENPGDWSGNTKKRRGYASDIWKQIAVAKSNGSNQSKQETK